jgi:hypothetical protein
MPRIQGFVGAGEEMTVKVRELLNSFEQLAESERHEAASEILRRTLQMDLPSLDDDTLVQVADELFLKLDEEENALEST